MNKPILRIASNDERSLPARRQLTEASVRSLRCPPGKSRIRVYDTKVRGLACIVTAAGSRSYYFTGRVRGRAAPIDFRLGDVEKINLETARIEAKGAAAKAAMGINPAEALSAELEAKRDAARKAQTIGDLWDGYRAYLLAERRASTLRTDDNRYRNHLSAWASRRARDIKPADVVELHAKLSKKTRTRTLADGSTLTTPTPRVADKSVRLLRRMFNWATITPNPAADKAIMLRDDNASERHMSKAEVGRLLDALDAAPNQDIADCIRLLIYTGARRGNAMAARWADFDLDGTSWKIPGFVSKSGKPMTISLAPSAVTLLRRREKTKGESEYVFPGRRAGMPLVEIVPAWLKIRKAAGLQDVRLHDIRHSVASWMAKNGASLQTIGRQLGHRSLQSTMRYSHIDIDTVHPAVERAMKAMLPAKPSGRSK